MIQIQKLSEAPQIWSVCWAIESLSKVPHPDFEDMACMAYTSRSYSLPFTWFFRSCILLNTLTDAPPPTTLSHITPEFVSPTLHGMSHHFEVCTVSENNGLMASSTSDIRGESPLPTLISIPKKGGNLDTFHPRLLPLLSRSKVHLAPWKALEHPKPSNSKLHLGVMNTLSGL